MKILSLFFILFNLSFSYINIHPTYFDKKIDFEGSYQEYTLYNQSNSPVTYRIYTESYQKGDRDMSQWINFYPRSLTLQPGEHGKIQLSVASQDKLPFGEYSAILGIRELPLYEKVIKENNIGLGVLTDLKIVLNGYAGDIHPQLEFSNLKGVIENNTLTLRGSIYNKGERRGKYELYIDNYFLGNLRILSKEKLSLDTLDFKYIGNKNITKADFLIVVDYITKKRVGKIKL